MAQVMRGNHLHVVSYDRSVHSSKENSPHRAIQCCVFEFTVSSLFLNPLNAELNPIRHLVALVGARHIVHVSRIRVNPLNAELNPIRHLLALVGARHIVHVSRIRVKVIHQLLTSYSSSSRNFYPSSFLSFNNVFWKGVVTQDVTHPASLPSFRFMQDVHILLDFVLDFSISHTIGPTDLLHPSPAPHFKTFKVLLIYFPKCPSFSTYTTML